MVEGRGEEAARKAGHDWVKKNLADIVLQAHNFYRSVFLVGGEEPASIIREDNHEIYFNIRSAANFPEANNYICYTLGWPTRTRQRR